MKPRSPLLLVVLSFALTLSALADEPCQRQNGMTFLLNLPEPISVNMTTDKATATAEGCIHQGPVTLEFPYGWDVRSTRFDFAEGSMEITWAGDARDARPGGHMPGPYQTNISAGIATFNEVFTRLTVVAVEPGQTEARTFTYAPAQLFRGFKPSSITWQIAHKPPELHVEPDAG